MAKITVQNTEISIIHIDGENYVSITDLARHKSDTPNAVIGNWMRNRNTIEYLGIWEQLFNPNFKPLEFEGFKKEAGLNAFTLSPKKWIESTLAIGLVVQAGRYGGTYAHKDIAFKFASWISVEFELYLVKEFQRLKAEEQQQIGWSAKRELAKINYHIHTHAAGAHPCASKASALNQPPEAPPAAQGRVTGTGMVLVHQTGLFAVPFMRSMRSVGGKPVRRPALATRQSQHRFR